MNEVWLLHQLPSTEPTLLVTAVLVNAAIAFAGAMAFVLLAARVCGSSRLAKWLLLAPFGKLLWDVARGASANAYVLSQYAGTHGEGGSFTLGFGLVPPLSAVVRSQIQMRRDGDTYAYSVGDFVGHGLHWAVGARAVSLLLATLLVISAGLLARRCVAYLAARRELALWRMQALRETTERLGWRTLRVITGAPSSVGSFTSGALCPIIWLRGGLPACQREAIFEHERAHARDGDALLYATVDLLGDVFWFVPGARWLGRRIRARAEQAADEAALKRGVSATTLAQAILDEVERGVAARPMSSSGTSLSGTARDLKTRLVALGAPRKGSRPWLRWARLLGAVSLTASALISTFGGYA